MRLYVDGILDSSLVTEGSTKTNDLPLFVGGAPYAEHVCDMPMLLDEFRMFSYVRLLSGALMVNSTIHIDMFRLLVVTTSKLKPPLRWEVSNPLSSILAAQTASE